MSAARRRVARSEAERIVGPRREDLSTRGRAIRSGPSGTVSHEADGSSPTLLEFGRSTLSPSRLGNPVPRIAALWSLGHEDGSGRG